MEDVDVFIVDSPESETSKVEILREIITEKLTTATREIFAVVEKTIVGYDKEVLMLKRELERYKRQLDTTLQPHVSPPTIEVNIVDGNDEDNDGKPMSNEEDDGARRETKEDEGARQETKEDEGARQETKEDEGARQLRQVTKEDEGARQETKEDEGACQETEEDEGARQETGQEEGARQETEEDEGARQETEEDEGARQETGQDEGASQETGQDEGARQETGQDEGACQETEDDEVVIVGDVLINTSSSMQKPLNPTTSKDATTNYVQTVNRKKRRRHTHHAGTGPSNGASGQKRPASQLNPDFFDKLWCAIPELSANPAFEAFLSDNQSSDDLPAASGMEVTEPEPMDEQSGTRFSGETPEFKFGDELLKGYVEKHMKVHTGESQQGRLCTVLHFTCPHCDYKTLRKDNLKVHMRIHTGEKPYMCSMCDRAFARSGSLKCHMKTHFPQLKYPK